MRKCFITLVFLFFSILIIPASPIIIQGKWNRSGEDVSLYQIISGRLETISTYNLQRDRTFGFAFTPEEEGYYVIGNGGAQTRTDKYIFYFKPGDKLNVEITENSYELIDENTPENQALHEWHNKIEPLESIAIYFSKNNITYVDFFPLLDEFIKNHNSVQVTGNSIFDNSFKKISQLDLLNTAVHFLYTPRSAHPHVDEYPDYYRNINLAALTEDASLLNYPFGSSMISQLLLLKSKLDGRTRSYSNEEALVILRDNAVKGEYILSRATRMKTYIGYKDLMVPNEQYIVTEDQINRARAIETRLAKEQKAGEAAIDFTAKDINGKDVSLSDFNGKVVFIDAWATWCAPCKLELPYFNKMAEQFAMQGVVFMGVSMNDKKDYDKWEDFVKTEKPSGVQLFAGGFDSDIARLYAINFIPRFLLIDKAGNIVSKDAPRPSSDELRVLIENELKK